MRAKKFTDTVKDLEAAKDNLRKVRDVHHKAVESEKIATRIPPTERSKEQHERAVHAMNWVNTTKKMLSKAELSVATLEAQVRNARFSAKGCVTPSGKRIRV